MCYTSYATFLILLTLYNEAILNVEGKLCLLSFCIITRRNLLKKLAPLYHSMRRKIKIEFWFARVVITLVLVYDTSLKIALLFFSIPSSACYSNYYIWSYLYYGTPSQLVKRIRSSHGLFFCRDVVEPKCSWACRDQTGLICHRSLQ